MDDIETGIYLTRPTLELKAAYLSFYEEWKESGEVMIPFTIKKSPDNFRVMLDYLSDCEKGIEPAGNWIHENSTFWLVDNFEVIGVVNIRHRLTEKLFNAGGHIGYGIRPSSRNQGYANKTLSLSLEKAKELGLSKVLVVCKASNTASERTILNNGGIADKDFIDETGNILKRYWIEI